jgi:hypothetical protein
MPVDMGSKHQKQHPERERKVDAQYSAPRH